MDALNDLKAVLCDPDGKCCISGSDSDRLIVDKALAAIERLTAGHVSLPEIDRELIHDNPNTDDVVEHINTLVQDYGDRRAAAAVLAERDRWVALVELAALTLADLDMDYNAKLCLDELNKAICKGTS